MILSYPTWLIHISSTIEWFLSIELIWELAKQLKSDFNYKLSCSMILFIYNAILACTWHFFENIVFLEWLIFSQSLITLVANIGLWIIVITDIEN
uniref:hypothetical protein n=1 Tax=Galdieria phlegrea TaxID=1389228 RepID=UPI0023D7F1D7|nr:hypothetical protein P2030_pgp149 [Galdieria phlegrea]UNJ16158.1 hypothetical protein [Galdieria sp.]WDA99600.1 hypothetical protein GASUdbv011_058 [Galdieria sulphuraria]WDA99790.1 hypothetical protein GAPH629S_058 [Galdieria phlegrea]